MDPLLAVYVSLVIAAALTWAAAYRLRARLGALGAWLVLGTAAALFRVLSFQYLFDLWARGKLGVTLMFGLPLYVPELFLFGDPFTTGAAARRFALALAAGSYLMAGVVVLVARSVSALRKRNAR